jgi:hypothetical protein
VTTGYDDPKEFADYELEDYYAQGPFLLDATTFAATLLEEDRFAAGFTGEADIILEAGIEQPWTRRAESSQESGKFCSHPRQLGSWSQARLFTFIVCVTRLRRLMGTLLRSR